jgi:hypothetical protein
MKLTTITLKSSKKNLASLVITWADKHRRVRKGYSVTFSIYRDTVEAEIIAPKEQTELAIANLRMILA